MIHCSTFFCCEYLCCIVRHCYQCDPYHFEDKVIFFGDAAHAMVPFFGQGMNSVRHI